jgi:Serine/threonine protein kinase
MLYHDGYIYAIQYIPGKPYVIEKRSSIDFSLISEYVHKQQGILDPVIGLNPYTGDLWVMPNFITKEEPENVINILDEDLVGKKNCSLQCLSNALFYDINFIFISFDDINFDEKGYAYLLSHILTDIEKAKDGIGGLYVLKYDRNGNLVSSVKVVKALSPSGIVYLKDRVYVVGKGYPEGREEVVLGVFSRDLEFLERRTIAEYYNDEVEDIHLERKHIVSDGEALYIGVKVSEKSGGRRFDLYSVSPLVEVLSVEEPRRAEVPVLRVDFTSIGIGDIVALLKQPVSGLVSGYSCADSMRFKTELTKVTAPKGFEGEWTCCLLGCGGWGCAYLCTRGEGEVVFKVPRGFEAIIEGRQPPTVHPRDLEKIKTDAEIISKLEHPNIIKLLGYSEKVPLLIYEFADYGSLYWQLSRGWKPSLKDVLLIGIQLGDALRYIHSRGLIHGDIKPSNVFIKNGVSKVGDFSSIVKLLSSASFSKMAYTVGFRAPEQVFADVKKRARELSVENRIDVYQLANLIVYLLTGESIDGEEAVDERVVREKVGLVEEGDLKTVLAKALAVEPEKRPSAEEFVKMLYTIYKKLKI